MKTIKGKLFQTITTAFAAVAFIAGALNSQAQPQPPGCTPGGLGALISVTTPSGQPFAHVGDTLTITRVAANLSVTGCNLTNGNFWVTYPSGGTTQSMAGFVLTPGGEIQCVQAPANSACLAFPTSYTIQAPDLGRNLSFTMPKGNACVRPGAPKTVFFMVSDESDLIGSGLTASGCGNVAVEILSPGIACVKNCANGVGQNGQITFSGFVTNTGDTVLFSVSVSNLVNGSLTLLTNIAQLNVGARVNFGGSYTPANPCVPTTDTIFVRGTDIANLTVTSQCTATCSNVITPCINVTKNCTGPVLPGATQTISGVVSNCGNVNLTNIIITDNILGAVTTIPTLNIGQALAYSKDFTAGCVGNTNTVTARATSICGQNVTNTATAVCPVTFAPCLAVTKNCDTVVVGQLNTVSGVVTNCGNITITNIVISDNLYGAITTIPTLAPGASAPYSKTVSNTCGSFPNTVTAAGTTVCGGPIQATASATCVVTENPCIRVTKTCDTVVVGQANLVTAVVTNCGNVPLHGITVVDNIYGSVGTIALLAPGGSATLTKSVTNTCGNFPNTVTATGLSPCNTSVQAQSTATCVVTENPCIRVTKSCDTVLAGQANTVTAVVTNCGNVPLHGITVVDNIYGSVGTIALLAPGGTATLTKSVTNTCGSFPNTVTATGLSPCNTSVQAQSTATCVVTENPCIRVTKTCDTVAIGQANTVTAVVTNCGNVPLHGITVVDNIYGSVGTIALLAPGGTATLTKSVTNSCGNFPNTVTAVGLSPCNTAVTNTSTATCSVTCAPQIKVYKQVVCFAPGGCEPFSANLNSQKFATGVRIDPANDANCPAFCYRITVTNSGNVTLSNLVVSDANTSDGKVLNLSGCGFPTTLPPGGVASCIVTTNHCVNAVNIVTASGVGQDSTGGLITVIATDTNRVVVNPISVACDVRVLLTNGVAAPQPPTCLLPGTPYIVRTVVINNGQFDLQNVRVASIGPDQLCNLPQTIANLAVNERRTNDCTFVCDQNSSHTYAVSVTGEASQTTTNGHVCDFNIFGQHIVATNQNPCAASVCCLGVPRICVTKDVVCELPTGCANNWSKLAIGVRNGDDCPSFCYRIRVTNCGTEDLRNVTVTDTNLSLAGCNFPTTLAVGQTVECVIAGVERCDDLINTVEAVGVGVGSGVRTNDTDFAEIKIREISITCEATVNGEPFIQIPCDGQPHVVTNAVRVCNTGDLPLTNISIFAPNLVALGGACADVANLRFGLGVGECTNIVLCVDAPACEPDCGIAFSNFVHIVAHVDLSKTNVCIWTRNATNGIVEITAETECEAEVGCEQPNACRVTGGGRQDADLLTCPDDVRYVTHGGQVGAPVGERTCEIDTSLPNWILGNPCIHGRWTHVRHEKGGLRGNFHARYYDTLECACLATNLASNCQYDAGEFGEPTKKHQVCNPGDKVAGPEPRKSPSNKITFTGVGDWACPNGRRAPRACLFRVDIEDRSEPGGSHPKGGTDPADRYRIRIWVLTPQETARLRDPNDGLLAFRNAIGACHGIDYLDGGAVSSNGKACIENNCSGDICDGTGATGTITFPGSTPVRTPNIDDGGELERGNHQIHPSIKHCDPANPTGPGLPGRL